MGMKVYNVNLTEEERKDLTSVTTTGRQAARRMHSPASLYEAFPPAEARRIVERLEIHYTPSTEAGLILLRFNFPFSLGNASISVLVHSLS